MKNYNDIKKGVSELLDIRGASGHTENVQEYVINRLSKIEGIKINRHGGNIVATLSNSEEGIRLGINAHMDTVHAFRDDRKVYLDVLEGDEILSTNDACLGADDRAGLALVLALMEDFSDSSHRMHQTFEGSLIAWITVDEEIGCIGAEELSRMGFFENLDMSITFDRRNERDIVCKNFSGDFCDVSYAKAFVKAGENIGQVWRPVEGSISDAMTSSEASVNSVNLSVGYDSEHTTYETLNLRSLYDTYQLAHSFIEIVCQEEIKAYEYVGWSSRSYGYGGNSYFADGDGYTEYSSTKYEFDYGEKSTKARMNTTSDGVEFEQNYYGENDREYSDYVSMSHNEFVDAMADYLSQNPSAYDELQRKITARSYGEW